MNNSETRQRRNLMRGVICAVAIWGSTIALGAYLFGIDDGGTVTFAPNPIRGLITLGGVAIFVGGWLLLLAQRRERTEPAAGANPPKPNGLG